MNQGENQGESEANLAACDCQGDNSPMNLVLFNDALALPSVGTKSWDPDFGSIEMHLSQHPHLVWLIPQFEEHPHVILSMMYPSGYIFKNITIKSAFFYPNTHLKDSKDSKSHCAAAWLLGGGPLASFASHHSPDSRHGLAHWSWWQWCSGRRAEQLEPSSPSSDLQMVAVHGFVDRVAPNPMVNGLV